VVAERAAPELLPTYSVERHAIAKRLIEFDKEWSKGWDCHRKLRDPKLTSVP